jgi:PatG C-terminal
MDQDTGTEQTASATNVSGCTSCGNPAPPTWASYIYALGNIEPRFPSAAIEKEFSQIVGRIESEGLTDRQAFHSVLSKRENRYLARNLCWTFTIQGLDTYVLVPRDPVDFDVLMSSVRPTPKSTDIDLVIGVRGGTAPLEMCNGAVLPLVRFDQLYSFDVDSFVKSIPNSKEAPAKATNSATEEVLLRVLNMTENAGAADGHRALNYLAVRCPAIYTKTAEQFSKNCALSSVDVTASPLGGNRKIVNVIFSYVNRATDVTEKFFARVDVTEEFPFLMTKMSPYYDR